jgi:uncharacterized protein with von Willebrand factor type A (vWA) domain
MAGDEGIHLARAARFSRWDGRQAVPNLDADQILGAMVDDLMAEGDVAAALRRLMERGWRPPEPDGVALPGLRDLLEALRRRREEVLETHHLGDVLADVRQELEAIVAAEREGIQRRLDAAGAPGEPGAGLEGLPSEPGSGGSPATSGVGKEGDPHLRRLVRELARRRLEELDRLPPDVGGRLKALQDYDFLEPTARERFQELLDRLRRSLLDRYLDGLSDALRRLRPEDLAVQREMVRELNRLLADRLAGREPEPGAVADFLRRFGAFFPGAQTLDDVVEQLAERMAAVASLLRSMTPEQQAELQGLIDALLRDDRLRWDLAQLAATLDQLLPGGLGARVRFSGELPLGLEEALDQLSLVNALDRLENQLAGAVETGDLSAVDREALQSLLGPGAAQSLEALDDLARRLEEAGFVARLGDRLELTPRGSRRIGQKVLDDLFSRLQRDAVGGHRVAHLGRGGERDETTKPFEWGDPFQPDLVRTVANATRRRANAGSQPGRLTLAPDDFEVYRTEELTRAATVLLVDMSRSMLLRGCFVAAKKVALALHTLIRSQFPHDDLAVIGFAYYAREIRPETLAQLTWHGYEYGTNLQHGLILARRYLDRRPAANKEIVIVTDGEPTAHFENGQVEFSYPPTRRTIQETLREVLRCTRAGITINTFMLERSRGLAEFVALMTRLNRGRAFYASPEHLGEYLLVDFVSRRTKRVH